MILNFIHDYNNSKYELTKCTVFPDWCAQFVGHLLTKQKVTGLSAWSGHAPGLPLLSPEEACVRTTN